LGRIDAGAEALNLPGSVKVTFEPLASEVNPKR
jgi:hypothetical protein